MKLVLIIIILIIILINIYTCNIFISICDKEPEYFIYSSKIPGPTILILGATHGNEPAGYYAIKEYMDMLNRQDIILKKGRIIFIPSVNYCGLKLNSRSNPVYGDINREYNINKDMNVVNKLIIKFAKESDFIIDFHEGYSFNRLNKNSLGSTISPVDTNVSNDVANIVVSNLNANITEDYKKFNILKDDGIKNTLRDYISKNEKKDYILVEITGQNDIQPLELRKNQGLIIISSVISYFKMDN
jgi:predicted deacylase